MATIQELESFKMSDAVKFHKELNPRLWEDNKLDPEVRDQLLLIAEDFVEYLGISNLKVKDVTISGSNAAYSYTPHSDLDLHVLVDFSELPNNEVYQELFTAKKTLYNDAHDITVRDVPVELYVQDTNNPVHSLGEYSIVHDRWIRIPKKRKANFDEAATKAKYEKLGDLIELALKSKDPKRVADTIALVKRYRKSGLDKHGEFGPENLAYKAVRKQGLVQDLYDLKAQLHGEKLSIEEEYKLLNKPTLTVAEIAEKHGVDRMQIAKQLDKGVKVELEHTKDKSVAREIALDHLAEDPKYYDKLAKIDLEEAPVTGNYADLYHTAWTDTGTLDSILQSGKLVPGTNGWLSLTRDSRLDYAKMMGQFAEFVIDQNKLRQRIKLDQYDDFKGKGADEAEERVKVPIPLKGYIKSIHLPASWKNNKKAREYYEPKIKQYGIPFYYDTMGSPEDRNADVPRLEEASGYIPSAKEKNDPRFKTALTVDVKPDAIKKNAKAFGWKTSRAGIPPQARADGKIAEDLMKEWKSFLAEDQEQQELFPGYDKEHREKRLDNWLQNTHAWDGHKPRVFYHATTKDFDTFNTHGTGFASALGMAFEVERHGSFFAVDPKFAQDFIEDPDTGQIKEGGRILPVYLSVQNPIDLRDDSLSHLTSNEDTVEGFKANDIDLKSIYFHFGEYDRWELFDGPEGAEFIDNLQKLGFDGAIINEVIPNNSNAKSGEVWVVFNPNQVKSVHNRGSFSPDDPRLMKENG